MFIQSYTLIDFREILPYGRLFCPTHLIGTLEYIVSLSQKLGNLTHSSQWKITQECVHFSLIETFKPSHRIWTPKVAFFSNNYHKCLGQLGRLSG